MQTNNKISYSANSLQEAYFYLKTTAHIKIISGGTSDEWRDEHQKLIMPAFSLNIKNVSELKQIERHERFIEIGSAVTLSEIEQQGEARLPKTIYKAIKQTATPFVRNLATLGGNVCSLPIHGTLFASLLALDARLEIHNTFENQNIPIGKFISVPEGWILTKIRIPSDNWDTAIFEHVGPERTKCKDGASFVFLANTEKGVLNSLSIAFAGLFSLKSTELENNIIGSRLPLSSKAISTMMTKAEKYFNQNVEEQNIEYNHILKHQYLNLLRNSLQLLT